MATSPLETCPVCLTSLANRNRKRKNELGRPECCDHMFCLSCILEWSKNVNTCPVDRLKFNRIDVFTSLMGAPIRRVDIQDVNLGDPLNDDYTYCEICHRCNREESLLLCDGCDKGFHLDCLTPPLAEVPEGDWYCTACEVIVQAQYDISVSSPDEESTYQPPYLALHLSDHSDTSSTSTEEDSDSELSDSSTIDVTGSESDIDLESISDSNNKININFGQDMNSDYLDSDGSFLAQGTSKSNLSNLARPTENGLAGMSKQFARKRRSVKSVGSSSASTHLLLSSSSGVDRQDQCGSDDEDRISHKPKARAPNDFVVISSSEEDDSVSVHRKLPISKRKNTVLSESEDSKSTIDVEHLFPSPGGSDESGEEDKNVKMNESGLEDKSAVIILSGGVEDKDSEVNVEATPSPVKLTQEDMNRLGAGPSSSSTPAVGWGSANKKRASGISRLSSSRSVKTRAKNRSKIIGRVQKRRKRGKKRSSRKRSKRRRLKASSRPTSGVSLEAVSNNNSLQRVRARTAATHTPRVNAMRQAVQESYRHLDKTEGLEYARYILVSACQSPRGKSRLLDNVPSTSSITSPASGDQCKVKSLGESKSSEDDSSFQRDAQKPTNRTYGFVPNRLDPFHPSQTHAGSVKHKVLVQRRHSVSDTANAQPLSLEDRRKAEIQRRLVSNSSTGSSASPPKSQGHNAKQRRTNSVSSQAMASSNLVDILCKNLDDLENKCEVKKDGTVVPIRLHESGLSTEFKVKDQSHRLTRDNQAKSVNGTLYHKNAVEEDNGEEQHKGKINKTRSYFNARRKISQSGSLGHHNRGTENPEGGEEQPRDTNRAGGPAKQGGLAGYKIPKLKVNQFLYEDDYRYCSVKQEVKSPDPKRLDVASTSLTSQQPQETGEARAEISKGMDNNTQDNGGLKEHKEQQNEHKAPSEPSNRPRTYGSTHVTITAKELVKKALDVHFDQKRIKNREYRRILERATLKIEKNPTEVPCESRVRKLVAGYVEAYRKAKFGY